MSQLPAELKYTKTHEWIRVESDGSLVIGITDHAQQALGDLVFVEAPETGRVVEAGEACAVVESVKAASDIYSPVAGEVTASNDSLADTPESVNSDPYGQGWIMRIQPADAAAVEQLLDADRYQAVIDEENA